MDVILWFASLAYATAATAYYLSVAKRSPVAETLRVGRYALAAGALLHLLDVVIESLAVHRCPVTSTQFAVSMTGLVTVAVFWALTPRIRIEPLGALVAPIGLVSLITTHFMQHDPSDLAPARTWLAVHVTSNVIGVGLFLLSAGVGVAYLWQSARLKSKRAGAGASQLLGLLPLELLMRRLLLIGFVPLSLGVVTGAAFARHIRLDGLGAMRVGLAYGVWLLAGVMIVAGPVAGWRGRKIAWGNIAGATVSVVVIVMYVLTPSLLGGLK